MSGSVLRVQPGGVELALLDEPDDVHAGWDELAERTGNVFATPDWLLLWWRHYGAGRRLLLTACRADDGRLAAILPLYLWAERPLRVVRFLGHGPGDQLGPVCAPADRPLAARALRTVLAQVDADAFVGDRLPGGQGWPAALGGAVRAREPSPLARFEDGDWNGYWAGRTHDLRSEVGRAQRRLAREHGVEMRLADDPARIDDDVEVLFRLHRLRWRDGESEFSGPDEPFQRAFARRAHEQGRLRLWILEVDGEPAAASYGFRLGRVESKYQMGRDPRWTRERVGTVIVAHAIRSAVEDGMEEVRFLRGGEPYKYRWATHDPGLETVATAQSRRGAVAVAAAFAVQRAPALDHALTPLKHALKRTGSGR